MMMVADVLMPNRCQAISNHHADSSMFKEYHSGTNISHNIQIALPPLNNVFEVRRSATPQFLCYWWVHLFTVIMSYVHEQCYHPFRLPAGRHNLLDIQVWQAQSSPTTGKSLYTMNVFVLGNQVSEKVEEILKLPTFPFTFPYKISI